MYKVYILYSRKLDRYYVGYTRDIDRRIKEHNRRKGKYTDGGIPWELVHIEEYETKASAMQREKYIKSQKSRAFIQSLISEGR